MAVNAQVSLSLYDVRGNTGTFLVYLGGLDDTSTLAEAVTAATAVKTLYRTVGDAGVKDATFSILDTAAAVGPASDADISSGASFNFLNGADMSRWGQFVPSFIDSLIESDGRINIGAGTPQSFGNALVAAVLGGNYTNNRYEVLTSLADAFLTSRKRRHRLK